MKKNRIQMLLLLLPILLAVLPLIQIGNASPVTLVIDPDSGQYQTVVNYNGTASRGQTVEIYFWRQNDWYLIDSTTANATGFYSDSFTVPSCVAGEHEVKAFDTYTCEVAYATFTVVPKIWSVSPLTGPFGTEIQMTGYGFANESDITVQFVDLTLPATLPATLEKTITTDSLGYFSTPRVIVAPGRATGDYNITATDGDGNSATYASNFTVTEGIYLRDDYGCVGKQIIVTGSNFTALADINITFSNPQFDLGVIRATTSGTDGSIETSFAVPETPGGSYTVNVTDSVKSHWKSFDLDSYISITPTSGYVGTTVTITSGTGWGNNTCVELWYTGISREPWDYTSYNCWNGTHSINVVQPEGDLLIDTIRTDSKGTFTSTATFDVPESPGGYHVIEARQRRKYDGYGAAFYVKPKIWITPTSGVAGQCINLHGNGFARLEQYSVWNDLTFMATSYIRLGGLVLDFGPCKQYVHEGYGIFNNEWDAYYCWYWYVNMEDLDFFDEDTFESIPKGPLFLDTNGTISHGVAEHFVMDEPGFPLWEEGCPNLKVPSLQYGTYDVNAYYWGIEAYSQSDPVEEFGTGYCKRTENASTTFTVVSETEEILTNLDQLEDKLDSLEATLTELETTLRADLDQLEDKLDSINTTLTELKETLSKVKTDVSNLMPPLPAIGSLLSGLAMVFALVAVILLLRKGKK